MSKEDQVKAIITEYLLSRDDVIVDLNYVKELAEELTRKLVVL